MSDKTKIEWTDATWNPITGCSVVSEGCRNCYAMRLAGTRMKHHPSREGLTRDVPGRGPVWNGQMRLNCDWLHQPERWRKPRMIFVCAHGDLFHENIPDKWIAWVFEVMYASPQHTFQVLTKRPERMREFLNRCGNADGRGWVTHDNTLPAGYGEGGIIVGRDNNWPLPNVWLGVSVEDQKTADERIPLLLDTPAAVRWVSAEPLLGAVDLNRVWASMPSGGKTLWDVLSPRVDREAAGLADDPLAAALLGQGVASGHAYAPLEPRIDWVVAGGESGPDARPMHPDWVRSLRDQCQAAGVPFLFKQWGEWAPGRPGDSIECGLWMHPNGETFSPVESEPFTPAPLSSHIVRSGKKAAGRELDGRTWDQYPEVSDE